MYENLGLILISTCTCTRSDYTERQKRKGGLLSLSSPLSFPALLTKLRSDGYFFFSVDAVI